MVSGVLQYFLQCPGVPLVFSLLRTEMGYAKHFIEFVVMVPVQ